MGRAEDLFDRLKAGGAAAVKELIADAQVENLWLDFKRSGNDGKGTKLHESDWKNLAKAVSGFANSDGGVIIWGVNCTSDPILGDVPTGTALLEKPTRFVSWLENAISACTVPAVPGVESVPIVETADVGYAVTLVPSSPLSPHQCVKPAGSVNYYLRAGSNFMQVPHAILAGMFGRRPQPKVFQTYGGSASLDITGKAMRLKFDVSVHIYNEGPAIARDAFMHILIGVPGGGGSRGSVELDPSGTGNWLAQMEFNVLASMVAKDGFRIAPQMYVRVALLELDLAEPFTSPFGMKISVGCEGAPMHVAEIRYEPAELQLKYQTGLALLLENNPGAQEAVLDLFFPK